jgi:hypothetical protein
MDDEVEIVEDENAIVLDDKKVAEQPIPVDEIVENDAMPVNQKQYAPKDPSKYIHIDDKMPPKTNLISDIQQTMEESKAGGDFQRLTLEFIKKYNPPGHTIYFQPGFGKTRVACYIIAYYLKAEPWRSIIIVAPSAVHTAFMNEFRYIKFDYDRYASKIHFISNKAYNIAEQIYKITSGVAVLNQSQDTNRPLANLDEYLVVYDEAQLFVNSICNGSKNASYIYESIMASKKCKIFLLTGSLIIKDCFEIVPYVNMCSRYELLPEYPRLFAKYFMDYKKHKMRNISIFKTRLFGWFSYYGNEYVDKTQTSDFATELRRKVIKVRMSTLQFAMYENYRAEEIKEDMRQKQLRDMKKNSQNNMEKFKKSDESSSTYRIFSRQACNLVPFTQNSIIEFKYENCPKLHETVKLALKLISEGQKGAIFSNFISHVGLRGIEHILKTHGFKNIDDTQITPATTDIPKERLYALLTGETSQERRDEIKHIFNSAHNVRGEILPLIMFSHALAEGVGFHEGRFIIINDYHFTESKIEQVIARMRRRNGHNKLPPQDRTIKAYIMLSVAPSTKSNVETTDEYLYNKAEKNEEMVNITKHEAKEASVICTAVQKFSKNNIFNCFTCQTKDMRMYNPKNLENDIKNNYNPCAAPEEKVAKEYLHEGKKYYYVVEDKKFYKQDPKTGDFTEVTPSEQVQLKKLLIVQ